MDHNLTCNTYDVPYLFQGDDPNKKARTTDAKPDDEKPETAFEALEEIQQALQAIRKPTGTQEAPARTCKDLALAHPELQSGKSRIY